MSRMGYLQALSDAPVGSAAEAALAVPKAGRYTVLVRYEAIYHFDTSFRLQLRQGGELLLDRVYGRREGLKIWAFGSQRAAGGTSCGGGLQAECLWNYGSTENNVWEGAGVGAEVNLTAGALSLRLLSDGSTAGSVDAPQANRNIDVVVLHPNQTDIQGRMLHYEAGAEQLALDGLLGQDGEVFARFNCSPDAAPGLHAVLPRAYALSIGPDSHLTNAVWNNRTNMLEQGCTPLGGAAANGGPVCPRLALARGRSSG